MLPTFPNGWSGSPVRWRYGNTDYRKLVGDGSGSSIVEACVLWICRNFPEAPVAVMRIGDTSIPEIILRHPFARKVRWPNPYYSGVLLWYGTLTSWVIDGNAYWLKIRDKLGRVVEYWYIPHWMIEPRWDDLGRDYITHYDYRPAGELIELAPRDVFHLRYGIDPDNTRKGRSPLRTLFLELGVDAEASAFSATMLKNLGAPGIVVTPAKDSTKPIEEADREQIKAKFDQKWSGENRGSTVVLSRAAEISQFGFNPQQMEFGAIRDIPEERVTAVLGIPAAVVGFGTGLQTAKVGATMSELRDQAYENNIIPTQRLISDELTRSELAEFPQAGERIEDLEVAFDLSNVRVLQEANGKNAERWSTLVRAHIAEVGEGRAANRLPVRKTDHVFAPSPGVQIVDAAGNVLPATPQQETAPAGEPVVADVQGAALNGAQITALLEMLAQVTAKLLSPVTAKAALTAAFPSLSPALIEEMVDAAAQFVPKPPSTPQQETALAKAVASSAERTERILGELKAIVVARHAPARTVVKEVTARDGNGRISKTRERELVGEET